MISEIIQCLIEDELPPGVEGESDLSDREEAEYLKDIWNDPSSVEPGWNIRYYDPCYLYDPDGTPVRKSRNLRGIRNYLSHMLVTKVEIRKFPYDEHGPNNGEGGIRIDFHNGQYWLGRFASYSVLMWSLRNWRNLYGAPLVIDGEPAGKIGYHNPALIESLDDDEFDELEQAREVAQPAEDEEYDLWQIKAAEPEFFSRRSMKFHGTRKIYKYRGNFIVLHNVKRMGGHQFGVGDWTLDQYVIYQFVKTKDSPDGVLLYKGSSRELSDVKRMIKTGDFKPRRQQLGIPESRPFQIQTRQLSPQEASTENYDISEINEFPIMRMSIKGSKIDYEESGACIWILSVATEPRFQNQGRATYLLKAIKRYADQEGKSVIHGTFTDKGEKYLKPTVKRLWPEEQRRPSELFGESEDEDAEDYREVYGGDSLMRSSENYDLIKQADGGFILICKSENCHPRKVEVTARDASYLMDLTKASFGSAAVMDFGCGVWAGPDPDNPEE